MDPYFTYGTILQDYNTINSMLNMYKLDPISNLLATAPHTLYRNEMSAFNKMIRGTTLILIHLVVN